MNAIIEQARSLDGYQDSSELLQRRDQDWVLDRAGIEPRSLLDLGCGIGSLLLGGARRWPGLQRLWGIERSPLRLEQARAVARGWRRGASAGGRPARPAAAGGTLRADQHDRRAALAVSRRRAAVPVGRAAP